MFCAIKVLKSYFTDYQTLPVPRFITLLFINCTLIGEEKVLGRGFYGLSGLTRVFIFLNVILIFEVFYQCHNYQDHG